MENYYGLNDKIINILKYKRGFIYVAKAASLKGSPSFYKKKRLSLFYYFTKAGVTHLNICASCGITSLSEIFAILSGNFIK